MSTKPIDYYEFDRETQEELEMRAIAIARSIHDAMHEAEKKQNGRD